MTNMVKRFVAILIATAMCLTLSITASAVTTNNCSTNGERAINSSISGYEQASISYGHQSYNVFTDSSGWGGMGVTIKNTCSSHYRIGVSLIEADTGRVIIDNATAYTDQEIKFSNLWHYTSAYYVVVFQDVPQGISFLSQTWIYG